jgi:beta-lactamase class A
MRPVFLHRLLLPVLTSSLLQGQGATNDLGILYPPGRAPILVTAFYCGSPAPPAEREAVLAAVGSLVAAELGGR